MRYSHAIRIGFHRYHRGFVVVFGIEFIDKVLKIDDPVGAIGVHFLCGASGTLLVGLFSDESGTVSPGLFYGGGFSLLGIEALGVVTVCLWVGITMTIVFQVIKHTVGLRVSEEEEIAGLDIKEHNIASSYADFITFDGPIPESVKTAPVPETQSDKNRDKKLTKVSVVTRQSKLSELLKVYSAIGVTGVTITNVLGCGTQKGQTEYYRGAPIEMQLRPKVKVEAVISKVPADLVLKTARDVLYTGHIGDGKIFFYNVENAVKVRTGEEGYDALQDTPE